MSFPSDPPTWLLAQAGAWTLVLARATGLAASAPGWATPALGWRVRLGLVVLLTAALGPAIGAGIKAPQDPVSLGRACLSEVMIGAALGWTAALVIAAARQAGEVVGAQAGLMPAALLDPDAGEEMTPLGHLYGLIALGAFLALDGPLTLVGSLADSYRVLPAGQLPMTVETASWAFGQVGQALGLALRLAAPAALALVLAGLALGLLGRAAPSVQLMALALPVRAAVGLILVLLGLATLAGTLAAAWAGLPGVWTTIPLGNW